MSRIFSLTAAAVLTVFLSAHAFGSVIPDQSNFPGQLLYNPLGPTFVPGESTAEMAQTFTVGVTGQLTDVDVELLSQSGGTNITLAIVGLVGGLPDTGDPVLASVSTIIGAGTNFSSFDLSSADLQVYAGEQLAYWLTGDFSRWVGSTSDSYSGGTAYVRFPGATDGSPADWAIQGVAGSDGYFQTFVNTPEPSTLWLFAAPLAALFFVKRFRTVR